MRQRRRAVAALCLLAPALLAAGCGSSGTTESTGAGTPAKNRPAPSPASFPKAEGKTLSEVIESAGTATVVLSPAAMVFYKGRNRFPFGVADKDRAPVDDAEVALYFAKVPKLNAKVENEAAKGAEARAQTKALEEPAIGPFPATVESLETKPAFRSENTADDPDAATSVYASEVDFPSEGQWRGAALIREGGKLTTKLLPSVDVGEFKRVPRVGQVPPMIHTPTAASVGGDLSKITTRVPPDTQNRVDFADVVGKEPVVLLFATPKFCQSQVCGPVVDVAEQVKHVYGEKAAFIHMEIYKENNPAKGVRPQVTAFRLPSEPWLFVIGRDGRIDSAVEGAFGVNALTALVKKAIAE